MHERTTAQNGREVSNFERITSETHALPAGASKTFRIWALGSHGESGGRKVGMNARRLFFSLQIQENIIFRKVEVIKHYIHPLHDL